MGSLTLNLAYQLQQLYALSIWAVGVTACINRLIARLRAVDPDFDTGGIDVPELEPGLPFVDPTWARYRQHARLATASITERSIDVLPATRGQRRAGSDGLAAASLDGQPSTDPQPDDAPRAGSRVNGMLMGRQADTRDWSCDTTRVLRSSPV